MRIVDVCAFYSPFGGGVRTYVDAKLRGAARFGHEIIVVAPGERDALVQRAPQAWLATIASPRLPVDRRYRYFNDEKALHRVLDAWQPDHVEASSPWSSAAMVGRWQGPASRSLVMHADPLATYAYRWLGGIAPTQLIDRCFGWFWRHLRGLGRMFDLVVCANSQLTKRLRTGGIDNSETVPMGVDPGIFTPLVRSQQVRAAALESLGLDESAVLLIGVGRFSGEKRWDSVLRAVDACSRRRPTGMLLIGDGTKRQPLELLAERLPHVAVLPKIGDRRQLATLLASSDALVHGCETETFCMVAAEARASGIPLIVPDRGGAADQVLPGAGLTYRSGNERALERAIQRFIDRGPELQRAAAARASRVRTIDEHFAELFARYAEVVPRGVQVPAALWGESGTGEVMATAS